MKLFIVFACVVASAISITTEEWEQFKTEHGKTYSHPIEEQYRRKIYEDNKKQIDEHNEKFQNGEISFSLKMNKFGDLLHTERAQLKGYRSKSSMVSSSNRKTFVSSVNESSLPSTVDWREKGVVTGVKDQGDCGGCWAFSAIGSLEGQHAIATGSLVSLSEQNLIDCSTENDGCDGGLMDEAFEYIIQNGGIDTEASYPFTGTDGTCTYSTANIGATEYSYVDIESGSESALKEAIATVGPISVAIDASSLFFDFYSSGVFDPLLSSLFCCSSESCLDHGVTAVGYGTESSKDYWLIKNSWGTSWGEEGYIKIRRNHNNECGVATEASYPVVSSE